MRVFLMYIEFGLFMSFPVVLANLTPGYIYPLKELIVVEYMKNFKGVVRWESAVPVLQVLWRCREAEHHEYTEIASLPCADGNLMNGAFHTTIYIEATENCLEGTSTLEVPFMDSLIHGEISATINRGPRATPWGLTTTFRAVAKATPSKVECSVYRENCNCKVYGVYGYLPLTFINKDGSKKPCATAGIIPDPNTENKFVLTCTSRREDVDGLEFNATYYKPEEVTKTFDGCPNAYFGGWGDWTPWSACNVICSVGTKSRTRLCNNPPPQHGRNCTGEYYQEKPCNQGRCPVKMPDDTGHPYPPNPVIPKTDDGVNDSEVIDIPLTTERTVTDHSLWYMIMLGVLIVIGIPMAAGLGYVVKSRRYNEPQLFENEESSDEIKKKKLYKSTSSIQSVDGKKHVTVTMKMPSKKQRQHEQRLSKLHLSSKFIVTDKHGKRKQIHVRAKGRRVPADKKEDNNIPSTTL